MINLLEIEPNKVPVDPKNYSLMLYGKPKVGKTTFVYELFKDRVLFIGTEQRHDAIAGIHVVHITTWSEYLQVLSQLRQPAVKEKYDVVCIDTTVNLYDFLETYVKNKHGVQNLSDVPYGAAWAEVKEAWSKGINAISNFGYNPAFIFHSKDEVKLIPVGGETTKKEQQELKGGLGETVTVVEDKKGKRFYEVNRVTYDGANRVIAPVNKIVDNIMYIDQVVNDEGELERVLRLRGGLFYDAGSTFENIEETISLCPEEYKKAIKKAVESNGKENISKENVRERRKEAVEYDFDALMEEARELGAQMMEQNKDKELAKIVDKHFGAGNRLVDATKDQVESLFLAVQSMKEFL